MNRSKQIASDAAQWWLLIILAVVFSTSDHPVGDWVSRLRWATSQHSPDVGLGFVLSSLVVVYLVGIPFIICLNVYYEVDANSAVSLTVFWPLAVVLCPVLMLIDKTYPKEQTRGRGESC